MPVADDPAALLQPFRLQCTHVQGSNSRHRDGENLLVRSNAILPEVALAQSSRRGSITLPKLRIALRDTSGRRAKSLERCIGAEAIRRIITACRSGRMAAGAIGGISENAPTRLSPAYEAEEPSALR
jgi:hypothetical protein